LPSFAGVARRDEPRLVSAIRQIGHAEAIVVRREAHPMVGDADRLKAGVRHFDALEHTHVDADRERMFFDVAVDQCCDLQTLAIAVKSKRAALAGFADFAFMGVVVVRGLHAMPPNRQEQYRTQSNQSQGLFIF
jgi:hypothetical protein